MSRTMLAALTLLAAAAGAVVSVMSRPPTA